MGQINDLGILYLLSSVNIRALNWIETLFVQQTNHQFLNF